jgi:hypothetical protein
VILERHGALLTHIWDIDVDGVVVQLVYDDWPNGVTITPMDASGQGTVDRLFELALKQSDPSGV